MAVEDDYPEEGLESREPSVEDLVNLCRALNAQGARYLVVGGFAVRAAGYIRGTMDVDLVIDNKRTDFVNLLKFAKKEGYKFRIGGKITKVKDPEDLFLLPS